MELHEIFNKEFSRLVSEARKKDEFEFINILLGYKGMGEIMALTHFYESESLFSDFQKILPRDPTDKNYIRLGLFLYCHFFEMNELYRITGNLLNVVLGNRFNPFLFESFDENQLYPVDKINELSKIADQCAFQDLISSLISLYQNRLRNSFFHSNYSIDGDEYIITSKNPVVINGRAEFSLSIQNYLQPLIASTLSIANTFFNSIQESKKSYTNNKIIQGRFPDLQPILVLGNAVDGLTGFQSLTHGGAIKITKFNEKPFLAAFNLTMNMPDKEISGLSKQLNDIINKNSFAKDDPNLDALSQKILAHGNSTLVTNLAIPYYNWGNNLVITAQKSGNPYQQKSLFKIAIEKYKIALQYNAHFAQAIHNIVLTELELAKVDSTFKLSNVDAFKMIEKSVSIDPNFSEGYSNVGLVAFNAGKELKGIPEAKDFFLKAAHYYELSSGKNPEDCNSIYSTAISFHEASIIDTEEKEKIKNAKLAYQKYKQAITCNKDDLAYIFAFSSFSEYYTSLQQEDALQVLTEALEQLNFGEKVVPDNEEIYYKEGNKYLMIAQCSDDKEANIITAIRQYEKAISLNATHEKSLNNLGWALVRLGQIYNDEKSVEFYKRAISVLDTTLKLYPNKAESYLNEGVSYLELYKFLHVDKYKNLSIECLNHANELHPGLADDFLRELRAL